MGVESMSMMRGCPMGVWFPTGRLGAGWLPAPRLPSWGLAMLVAFLTAYPTAGAGLVPPAFPATGPCRRVCTDTRAVDADFHYSSTSYNWAPLAARRREMESEA